LIQPPISKFFCERMKMADGFMNVENQREDIGHAVEDDRSRSAEIQAARARKISALSAIKSAGAQLSGLDPKLVCGRRGRTTVSVLFRS